MQWMEWRGGGRRGHRTGLGRAAKEPEQARSTMPGLERCGSRTDRVAGPESCGAVEFMVPERHTRYHRVRARRSVAQHGQRGRRWCRRREGSRWLRLPPASVLSARSVVQKLSTPNSQRSTPNETSPSSRPVARHSHSLERWALRVERSGGPVQRAGAAVGFAVCRVMVRGTQETNRRACPC
jgi:hypothetical protein